MGCGKSPLEKGVGSMGKVAFVAKVLAGLPNGATPSLVVAEFAKALAAEAGEAFKAEAFFKAAGTPWLVAVKA
jgi:hypothetical protein